MLNETELKKMSKKVFGTTGVFFRKYSDNPNKRFCDVCVNWQEKITPVCISRTPKNSDCHLILNGSNECPFYSQVNVSIVRLKAFRIASKIKLAVNKHN